MFDFVSEFFVYFTGKGSIGCDLGERGVLFTVDFLNLLFFWRQLY